MNNKFLFLLFVPFYLLVVGCDRIPEEIEGDEMARFDAWIEVNNLSNYKTPSGIYYINEREGTGISPEDSDIVIYSYVVRNLDDYIYLNTYKDTAKLYDIYGLYKATTHYVPQVGQFISKNTTQQGFADGIGMMKEGGKARFIMPSSLAYGRIGNGSISAYTSLIYDVELKRVFKGDIEAYEKSLIDDYMADSLGYTLRSDSIYYKLVTPGIDNGGVAKDSIVTVNYTGRFLDGFIFDTNIKSMAIDSGIYNPSNKYLSLKIKIGFLQEFENQGPFLPSFHLAIKQMKEGEKAKFIIPSKYMYGAEEKKSVKTSSGVYTTAIPPYTPLMFEIELLTVKPK